MENEEKKYKAVVNHTGRCNGYSFTLGVEIELPRSVIEALGNDVKVIGEERKLPESPITNQDIEDQKKEVKKPFLDRMMHGDKPFTK